MYFLPNNLSDSIKNNIPYFEQVNADHISIPIWNRDLYKNIEIISNNLSTIEKIQSRFSNNKWVLGKERSPINTIQYNLSSL